MLFNGYRIFSIRCHKGCYDLKYLDIMHQVCVCNIPANGSVMCHGTGINQCKPSAEIWKQGLKYHLNKLWNIETRAEVSFKQVLKYKNKGWNNMETRAEILWKQNWNLTGSL